MGRQAGHLLRAILLLPGLCCLAVSLRGVDPRLRQHYQPVDGRFRCLDGKRSVPWDWVNDDSCDCFDGSDEPGTAACPNGRFYCANVGSQPLILNASFVDDGVCDCCDGADEPAGRCANTCRALGERVLAELQAELHAAQAGAKARSRYIKEAASIKKTWQARLEAAGRELPDAEEAARAAEEAKKALEAEEAKLSEIQKRAEERAKKAAEAAAPAAAPAPEAAAQDAAQAEAQPDAGAQQAEAAQKEESSEELAQRVAAQWIPGAKKDAPREQEQEQERSEQQAPAAADAAPAAEGSDAPPPPRCDDSLLNGDESDVDCGGASCPTCAPGRGCVGPSDCTSGLCLGGRCQELPPPGLVERAGARLAALPPVAWALDSRAGRAVARTLRALEAKLPEAARSRLPWHRPPPPAARLVAVQAALQAAREAASAAASRERELRGDESGLRAKLAGQYGESDVFVPLVDKCISAKVDKYTYEVCPFGSAAQKEGGSSTNLGSWQGFSADGGAMLFGQGTACWQGPARSITVSLRCGSAESLARVEEPSRCEYAAMLTTPALCTPAAVAALQARVDVQAAALASVGGVGGGGGAAAAGGAAQPQHEELRR